MARTNPITSLVLLLIVYIALTDAAAVQFRTGLAPRQTTTITPPPSGPPVSCADYSRIANLSTIALNAKLRGGFLRSSSLGTFAAARILDVESPKLVTLMFDVTLNLQCGNLSELALVEADRNYTSGSVAGMKLLDAPGVAPNDLALPVLCILFIVMMGVPAMSV